MHKRTIQLNDAEIPAWTYAECDQSIYTLVSAIALAGLEDKWIRLSADLQRKLCGFAIFGKQLFCIRKDGTFTVTNKCAYGKDFNDHSAPQSELIRLLPLRKAIRAGHGHCVMEHGEYVFYP